MILTANQVLNKYWGNTAPIDPIAIAKKVNIDVYKVNMPENLKDLSGLIWKNNDKNRIEILVNKTHPETRQRFTIAHELGHFFNTEEFNGEFQDKIYTRGQILSPEEVKANKFAAELLMPKEAIEYFLFVKKYSSINKLAKIFNVSEIALVHRLKNLGIIDG